MADDKAFLSDTQRNNNASRGEMFLGDSTNDTDTRVIPSLDVNDGGFVAWKTVCGAWCLMFATFGMTNSFGVYQDFYSREYLTNYSPSEIGWIGSTQLFLLFFLCWPAGTLFDVGYFHHMIITGSIIYIFSLYMLSLAKPQQMYQVFLTHGIGMGLSLGVLYLPGVAVVSHHFQRRRTFAMGIVMSGSSCGSLLFPWLTNHLILTHGFGFATRIAASICCGMLIVANLLMRTTLPPKMSVFSIKNSLNDLGSLLKERNYTLFLLAFFLGGLGLYFPLLYLQLYAIKNGVEANLAFHMFTILNGSGFLGRLLPPLIADIYGVFNVASLFSVLQTGLLLSMIGLTSASGIAAFAAFYGAVNGTWIAVIGSCMASMAPSLHEVGTRMGVGYLACSFGLLAFSPISGAILGPDYHWTWTILFHGLCLILSTAIFVYLRFSFRVLRGTQKV
ncbi:related to Monocarboxylate transporter [Serendipita indica DSM 11827]|uniref:Related to Monocarboxylate transporter n=1 Tax=Serendipita indica (strain DSM 11827) TaxID=1109443 RepID=G4TMU4_SERID|nr:related to Monocarboxylate transporter [Serendipita indica DSM 11827]